MVGTNDTIFRRVPGTESQPIPVDIGGFQVRRWFQIAAVAVVVAVAVAGCGTNRNDVAYVERPVEELYNQAMDNLVAGQYSAAAENFDEVERQHPYSIWATRAQLMTAFSHYQANKFDYAVIAAQRYIQLHPGSEDVAYAYYLIGVSYYEQIVDVGRDQKLT